MAHDVFISFSFKDQEIADKISNQLTNIFGIPCWICNSEIRAGTRFYADIVRAIRSAKVFLLVQTRNSIVSKEVVDELLEAIQHSNVKIIPFLLEDSDLRDLDIKDEDQKLTVEFKLRSFQRVDGRKDPLDERIKELAIELCKVLDRPFLDNEVNKKEHQYSLLSTTIDVASDEVFIGRDSLLEEIHASFERQRTVFLQGMGGIGKSELAKQYYYKYKESNADGYYSKVVFARYDGNLASLIADDLVFNIKGVSRKVNKNEEVQSDEEYSRDKINILKRICDNKTLFIIDNFDVDVDDEKLFDLFIEKAPYRVLVTTRNSQADYKVIQVKELDDESLKTIFIKYYGEDSQRVRLDDPAFTELFEWTNRHTLTVELIAKYMKYSMRVSSLRDMLDLLQAKHLTVFSEVSRRKSQKNSYDKICDILRISTLSEDDLYFLRCLSLMPSSGISYIDFFEKWIHREGDSDFFWDDILGKLSGLSIVKANKNSGLIYLHPIVKEVVLNELKPSYENCKEFINKCAMMDSDAIPEMWGLPYSDKAILLECYENILNIISDITPEIYPVCINMSYMYNYIGTYAQAIALHERLYSFVCDYWGKESKEAMLIYNHIAWKNSNCYLFERAFPYYETAANWFYQNPCYETRESHDVIRSFSDVCYYIYKETKDKEYLKKAYEFLDKSSKYGEQMISYSADKPEQFRAYLKYQIDCVCRNYLKLYIEEQKYDLAKECLVKYRQAVSDFQKASISPNADMAGYYRQFATLEYKLENYLDAYEALKESYRLYLQYFSIQNPRMISVLEELVMCCIKLKNYKEINEYLSIAIEGASAIFTQDHPTLVRLLELKTKYGNLMHTEG